MEKKVKRDYNTKKDNYFSKIDQMLSGGKYTHSMNIPLNNAHKRLAKEEKKK